MSLHSHSSNLPPFPRSMMRASADEIDPIELVVISGEIPQDLSGHVFLVGPVGSVVSKGLPNPDNSHVWNGNGMIYRFDIQPGEQILLRSRLAHTPCYWADLATCAGSGLGFQDWGMARFSPHLGMRNPLNTNLVPMRFRSDEATRLLIAFDGGRPYEIDPVSLDLITPVGSNQEWCPSAKSPWPYPPFPFPPVLSTAHPVFDSKDATLYTVNYGRSTSNLLATIPLLSHLLRLKDSLVKLFWPFVLFYHAFLKPTFSGMRKKAHSGDFVTLLAWDGHSPLRGWGLVDREGIPIRIQQTIHQIASTRDYLILADTSLKFGMEQLLPGPLKFSFLVNRILRKIFTKPQMADTPLYIISKRDLIIGCDNVVVRSLRLPLESAHFLVEDGNDASQIILHTAHECASDVFEMVRPWDVSPQDSQPLDNRLQGMISVGAMDVGRLGRYVIDAEKGIILEQHMAHDLNSTWGLGLYTCRDNSLQAPSEAHPVKSIYWQSFGFWPELLSKFVYNLYADYPHRLVPLEDILGEYTKAGQRPSTLFRLDTSSMRIEDCYPFPQRRLADGSWEVWICNSPQFIPRPNKEDDGQSPSTDPSTDGWIFCIAVSEQSKEVWIFDAVDLAKGPVCRLGKHNFDPGYTIHSTWLPSFEKRRSDYCIDVRSDYDPLIKDSPQAVRDLFVNDVYPRIYQHGF